MTRNYSGNFIVERDIAVQNVQSIAAQAIASEPPSQPIKMEVGIEECLHIDFEYDKQKYHLNDVILGKIYFLLVRIKIKHMELAVIRREAAGTGQQRPEHFGLCGALGGPGRGLLQGARHP